MKIVIVVLTVLFISLTSSCNKILPPGNPDPLGPNLAMRLPGASLISYGNAVALEPPLVTLEMLVWFDTLHATMIPLVSATGIDQWNQADGYGFVYENGRLYFVIAIADNFSQTVFKDTLMPANKWIHIAGTYDKQSMSIYMDGVLVGEKAETTSVYYGQNGFVLGQGYHSMFGINYFVGKLDEVRVWGVARTQQQLVSAMRRNLSGMETGLLGYWNFDQSLLDSVVRDKTGAGNIGTISGGAEFVLSTAF